MFKLSPYLKKIFYNISWLAFDQVLRAIVGVLIARYLGKSQFGTFNFALAFVSLFVPLINFFDSMVIRDLVSIPGKRNEILGSNFLLRFIVSVFIFSANVVLIEYLRPKDELVKIIVAIVAFAYLFQVFDVIDLYFRSQLKSKLTVWAKSPVFLLMNALKILCLIFHFPLISFAIIYTLEFALGSVGLILVYQKQLKLKLKDWSASIEEGKYIYKEGWPLVLAHISSSLYTYMDQVLIGTMLGDASVGSYSAAAKFYQLGLVVIMILNASFFPLLTELYNRSKALFLERYRLICEMYTMISYLVTALVLIFADWGMPFLFGRTFTESGTILKIQIIGFIFGCNGGLRSIYISITSNQKSLLYTTAISSAMNIILNILLIPVWGVYGSAIATVITQIFSLLFLNIFFKEVRILFFLQLKAFFPILLIQKALHRLKAV